MTAALLLAACTPNNGFDKTRLADPTVSLSVRHSDVFVYDDIKCQMVYDQKTRSFTAGTDTMSDYFTLTLSSVPTSSGQTVTGDISWTTDSSVSSHAGLTFEVVQVDMNGTAWLWNARQEIAVVISVLR